MYPESAPTARKQTDEAVRLLRKVLKTQEVKKDISAQRRGFAKVWEHELMVSIKNSEHGVHAKGRRRGKLKISLNPGEPHAALHKG